MRPNPLLFTYVFPRDEVTRCCTDEPRATSAVDPSPSGRVRKLRTATASALAVFRRTVAEPARVPVGTTVRTSTGLEVGRVREVIVALPSGRTSYAVDRAGDPRGADVLLIPRTALRHRPEAAHAVVDERVATTLARSA